MTATRPLLRRDERRASILDGAATAFSDTGFAATSMESIAASAGVSKLIVYRHFDSKEELYRAVLQQVFDRLAEEFLAEYTHPGTASIGARSLLTVAREEPAGFQLLWRHAAREPAFAEYARELRDHAVDASRTLLAGRVDASVHEWAAQTVVSYLVEATLNWLDHGDPERDDVFLEMTSVALRAAVLGWTGAATSRTPD